MSSSVPCVQPSRIRILKEGADRDPAGPVVYWMFRDQRLRENRALIQAVHQANQLEVLVAIAFNLFQESCLSIPFFLFQLMFSLDEELVRVTILKAVDVFLEELVVRMELSDNFCFYQPLNDSLQGAWEWAQKTLTDHASDKWEHLYTIYWTKKILEWTTEPEEALATPIYLNDKYQINGWDPNGYVGCMWSICGIHD